MIHTLRTAALALLLPSAALAQLPVGERVALPELEGFSQIAAKSSQDLVGRAVLFEFFAFW
ncbi:MAG: hypothetical protein JNM84_14680 [Planctomycetes bacterium]|nr:hypothetical protein [Planctomycetota bacterium]